MNKDNETDFNELFRLMGVCLFASQRIEYTLQTIITLCSGLFADKDVNSISIKAFLDNSGQGKKIRKKTLGALCKLFQELKIIDPDRLDTFVASRNFIIHSILQPEPNNNAIYRDLTDCIIVCRDFISEAEKIENGLKGLIYKIYTGLQDNVNLPKIQSVDGWTIFEKDYEVLNKTKPSNKQAKAG